MPPRNVMIFGSASYYSGSTIELRCSSFGDPPFEYTWTRAINGVNNPFPSNIITSSDVLYISNVAVTDGGEYTCTVANNIGSDSTTVTIHSRCICVHLEKCMKM